MEQTTITTVQDKTTVRQLPQAPPPVIPQQPIVVETPEVEVKGVGFFDKLAMKTHDLKEKIKDKMQASKETKEMKKLAEAEMKTERERLEAQHMPVQEHLSEEKKVLQHQRETAISGLKAQLDAEKAELEQKHAAIRAQLGAEKQALEEKHQAALCALETEYDVQKRIIEQRETHLKTDLDEESKRLKREQEERMSGIKANLKEQKKAMEYESQVKREVQKEQFVDKVMYDHTLEAKAKQQELLVEAERKAVEESLARQRALEIAAAKNQPFVEKETVQTRTVQSNVPTQPDQMFVKETRDVLNKRGEVLKHDERTQAKELI